MNESVSIILQTVATLHFYSFPSWKTTGTSLQSTGLSLELVIQPPLPTPGTHHQCPGPSPAGGLEHSDLQLGQLK